MITEDSLSENQKNEPITEDVLNENTSETEMKNEAEVPSDAPAEEVIEEPKVTEKVEEAPSEGEPAVEEKPAKIVTEEPEAKAEKVSEVAPKQVVSEKPAEHEEEEHHEEELESLDNLSLAEVLVAMETIVNKEDAGAHFRKFNQLKEKANHLIHDQTEDLKSEFVAAGNPVELFSNQHPSQAKLSGILHVYREKNDEYHKKQEENHHKNLEHRQSIIDSLKNLYTNTEAGTNLFKAIREIKEDWKNAGQVAKSEFKLLNNNYFHH